MKSIFVAGTDTGVGKTVVATILAKAIDGYYWKPIQSGIDETDTDFVRRWYRPDRTLDEAYCLQEPLAPTQAAELEGIQLSMSQLTLPTNLPKESRLIVEGTGGVMVPITQNEDFRYLLRQWDMPAIIVARSSLGTLNHTRLTLHVLREFGIHVVGVILVGSSNVKNRRDIEHYGDVRVIREIDWVSEFSPGWFDEQALQLTSCLERFVL